MATPASKGKTRRQRLLDLVTRDPLTLTTDEIDALIREGERRIDLFTALAQSEGWKIARDRLDARRANLDHQLKGLLRRLVHPLKEQPAVTLEQIAGQQRAIDENDDLVRFPQRAIQEWTQQVAHLRTLRERRT